VSLAELGVLQVDRVTAGDHGTYRCTATNDVRQRHSADARLTVLTAAATTGQSVSQSVHLSRSHQPTAALSLEVTCTRRRRGGQCRLKVGAIEEIGSQPRMRKRKVFSVLVVICLVGTMSGISLKLLPPDVIF